MADDQQQTRVAEIATAVTDQVRHTKNIMRALVDELDAGTDTEEFLTKIKAKLPDLKDEDFNFAVVEMTTILQTMQEEAERSAKADIDYLFRIPESVPSGKIVVHNNVRPTRRLGSRGFRAWLAESSPKYEVCQCEWAPELGAHYRVCGRQQLE